MTSQIELRGRNRPSIYALVDDWEYDRVMAAGPWCRMECPYTIYVRRVVGERPNRGTEFLHTFITGFTRTDHIDHNGQNNQWSNMRDGSGSKNNQNASIRTDGSSIYRGVCWFTDRSKWRAYITVNKKRIWLGSFDDEVEAALAYDARARIEFGEYAYLNFPRPGENGLFPTQPM